MSLVKTLTLIVFTTALATGALAKGHDQGRTDTPGGPDARTETAEGAHAGVGKDTDNISKRGAQARASKGKPARK